MKAPQTLRDKSLSCQICGRPFTFAATVQLYFRSMGWSEEPTRCLDCRQKNLDRLARMRARGQA